MKKTLLALQGINIPLSVYLSISAFSSLGSILWLSNAVLGGVWIARNIDKALDDRDAFKKYYKAHKKEFEENYNKFQE